MLKNEVAKQLENATILNDKFKLKLEEDKKRAEEETKQRKARQEEIFKKELFDANTKQEEEKKLKEEEVKKLNLAQKLQGTIRGKQAKGIRDTLEKIKDAEFIAKEKENRILKSKIQLDPNKIKLISKLNEKYNKDYPKRLMAQEQLYLFSKETKTKKDAASKIQAAARGGIAKSQKLLNTNVSEIINKMDNAPRNQSNQLTLYKGSNQPKPKPLKLSKK